MAAKIPQEVTEKILGDITSARKRGRHCEGDL